VGFVTSPASCLKEYVFRYEQQLRGTVKICPYCGEQFRSVKAIGCIFCLKREYNRRKRAKDKQMGEK
jgi:hypothetical protein